MHRFASKSTPATRPSRFLLSHGTRRAFSPEQQLPRRERTPWRERDSKRWSLSRGCRLISAAAEGPSGQSEWQDGRSAFHGDRQFKSHLLRRSVCRNSESRGGGQKSRQLAGAQGQGCGSDRRVAGHRRRDPADASRASARRMAENRADCPLPMMKRREVYGNPPTLIEFGGKSSMNLISQSLNYPHAQVLLRCGHIADVRGARAVVPDPQHRAVIRQCQ
jgi:hypothetical protein